MSDLSSPKAADRSPDSVSPAHGQLWLWGLAALVVALSASIVAAAWIAGSRSRTPAIVLEEPLLAPTEAPVDNSATLALLAERERAAEAGDAAAQYEVALVYLDGTLVPGDVDRATDLLRRSAAQDYIPGIMTFAELYGGQVAAGADPGEVFAALDRLIADPPDDTILGAAHEVYGRYLYRALPPPERDPAGAVDHFVASLAAGNFSAARLIAEAYRTGEGRPVDEVRAYAYLKVAQPTFPDQLGPTIYEMETSFTPAQLAEAASLTLPVLLAQEPDLSH